MRKKPYTGYELFNVITDILKDKDLIPDIVDYTSARTEAVTLIKNEEFEIRPVLMYGGSEGFYIDINLYGNFEYEKEFTIGVIKTLSTSPEDIHKMAVLAADYVIYGTEFINKNLDDFTFYGYDVYVDGKAVLTCGSLERAEKRAEIYEKNGHEVKLFNNELKKFL